MRISPRLPKAAAALLGAALLLAGCGAPKSAPKQTKKPPANLLMGRTNLGSTPAPNFTLTNQFGQSFSLKDFRGKVVLVAFTDSQCTTICPLTTASMVQAVKMLGPAGKDVQLLGIDANPDAISVKDVYDYSKAHDLLHSWQFGTGSLATLKHVWNLYHIEVAIVHGQIDHTPALFLIDQQGRERYLYLTNGLYGVVGAESKVLAYDISQILPKGAAHIAKPKMPQNLLPSPSKPETLPALGPGKPSVTIGPGKARIVVFFATWLPGVQQSLRDLATYDEWAKTHGAPQVVAVDELPTEPSLATARARLQGLAVSFPTVLDRTGLLADSYRVQDMPWIAFYSKDGKIVDSHDGFVTVAALEQQVAKDFHIAQ